MIRSQFSFALFICILLAGCTVQPEPISFGKDNCDYCRMTATDKRFGAEIITVKGRIFKFDAIECMLHFVREKIEDTTEVREFMVIDTSTPGNLINVKAAGIMFSPKLPSPMRGDLSAYKRGEVYQKALQQYAGRALEWNELKEIFGLR